MSKSTKKNQRSRNQRKRVRNELLQKKIESKTKKLKVPIQFELDEDPIIVEFDEGDLDCSLKEFINNARVMHGLDPVDEFEGIYLTKEWKEGDPIPEGFSVCSKETLLEMTGR
jgi:hypothetical protein